MRRGIPKGRGPAQAATELLRRPATPSPPERRPLERIWATVGPSLVGATAAATLFASVTMLPSFATTIPAGHGSAAPGTAAAAPPGDTISQLVIHRQEVLSAAASEIAIAEQGILLERRRQLARTSASMVKTEISRLRNLSTFRWPTEGGATSGFGPRLHPILGYVRQHNGADIGGACNNPIYAAQSGKVIKTGTGYNGGSGNNVRLDHGTIDGTNVQTAYLHMTRFVVKVGQHVDKGDVVGYVGNTGLSTGCHLHLSLYKGGVGSNPLEYIKK